MTCFSNIYFKFSNYNVLLIIMPFVVRKQGNKYRLYNLQKKIYTKRDFNTRKSASNMKNVYQKYDVKNKK